MRLLAFRSSIVSTRLYLLTNKFARLECLLLSMSFLMPVIYFNKLLFIHGNYTKIQYKYLKLLWGKIY